MIGCNFENGNEASLRHLTVNCIVTKDSKILLAKRSASLSEGGKWCLLGGFAGRDETMAQTGARETMEESGWSVTNMRLFLINDNPDRPNEDRQNVEFVYLADAVAKEGEKDWESEDIRWFELDQLPAADQIAFDHGDSIALYRQYLATPFQIPVSGYDHYVKLRSS